MCRQKQLTFEAVLRQLGIHVTKANCEALPFLTLLLETHS